MPIPVYKPQEEMKQGVPGVMASPAAAAVPFKAAAEAARMQAALWQHVGKLGDELLNIGADVKQRIRTDKQIIEGHKASSETLTDLVQLSRNPQLGNDPETAGKNFDEQSNALVKKRREGIQDPAVQVHLIKQLFQHLPYLKGQAMARAQERQIEQSHADAGQLIEDSLQGRNQTDDPAVRAKIDAQVESFLHARQEIGMIKPNAAQKALHLYRKSAILGEADRDIDRDPQGAYDRLRDSQNYPTLTPEQRLSLQNKAQAMVTHRQHNAYSGLMVQMLKATSDNPTAAMPAEHQVQDMIASQQISPDQGKRVLGVSRKFLEDGGKHSDPGSYAKAYTRLYDHENPLTAPELIKNVGDGEWRLSAKDYATVLGKIDERGTKKEKAIESAFKSRVAFWKNQFGGQARNEHYQDAVSQASDQFESGALGGTPEEVNRAVDQIFKPHWSTYHRENMVLPPAPQKHWYQFGRGLQATPSPTQEPPGAPDDIRNEQDWMSGGLRGSRGAPQKPAALPAERQKPPEPQEQAPSPRQPRQGRYSIKNIPRSEVPSGPETEEEKEKYAPGL